MHRRRTRSGVVIALTLALVASACGDGGDESADVAAGFTLVDTGSGALVDESDIVPGVGAMVFFENPDGVPGQITINPQPSDGGTSLNVNFFRADGWPS